MTAERRAPDPLDLSLRELLARLLQRATQTANDADPWVDPRGDDCPVAYRRVLAAARAGELELCKVGRSLLVRRSELDAWIEAHRVGPPRPRPARAPHKATKIAHILRKHGIGSAEGAEEREVRHG